MLTPLTPRQLEVLRLVGAGAQAKEAGRALGIRRGTVKVHLTDVHRRLGVDSTLRAVVVAIARGWLDPAELAGAR